MRYALLVVFLVVALVAGTTGNYLLRDSASAQSAAPAAEKADSKAPAQNLLDKLPDGYRAFTFKTHASATVAAAPNAHVDLICFVADAKDPKQTMAKVFLQNRLVVAVEPSKEPDHLLVTIALLPEEGECIARALNPGPVLLMWRKPGNNEVVKTNGAVTPFRRGSTAIDRE